MSELLRIEIPTDTGRLPPESYTPPRAPLPMPRQVLERERGGALRLWSRLTAVLAR